MNLYVALHEIKQYTQHWVVASRSDPGSDTKTTQIRKKLTQKKEM